MPFTTYTSNKILDHLDGKTAFTQPAVWVGVSSTTPTLTGTSITEPSTGSYARVATTGATWLAAASGLVSNAAVITFPTATADWLAQANLTYGVLFDTATAGNCLGYVPFSVVKNILNGDTFSIAIGAFTISLS
jgi:hypothetical protein